MINTAPEHCRRIFEDYTTDNEEVPWFLPPPDPRDPDSAVLSMPLFELTASSDVFSGALNGKGLPFRPIVGMVSQSVRGTRAAEFQGFHIAALNVVSCVEMYLHFQALLSHPGVFTGCGNASAEGPRIAWANNDENRLFHFSGGLHAGETFGPVARNKERQQIGVRLYHWAMRFIGFHELGHLVLGHVELLNEETVKLREDDGRDSNMKPKFDRLRRVLEHQADLHAVQRLAWVALIDSKASHMRRDALLVMLFEMFVAVLAVLRMWSYRIPLSERGLEGMYPHCAVRWSGIVNMIRTHFSEAEICVGDAEAWVEALGIAIAETFLQDRALGCAKSDGVFEWMEDYAVLVAAYEELNKDFLTLGIAERLSLHRFGKFYDGGSILYK